MSLDHFHHSNILDIDQFSREDIQFILHYAQILSQKERRELSHLLEGYILASLFFESSTRTRLSFETAMIRLGGKVISTVGFQFSSISKGESLSDTMKMIEAYADLAVIRHPVEGSSRIASAAVDMPVINAGDGSGQHPTQALLDVYTIFREKGCIDGLQIAFVGDLKYGRTIHSLVKLLYHYDVKMIFIAPVDISLPESHRKELKKKNIQFEETEDLKHIWDCDVAYITRIQQERFGDQNQYELLKNAYSVNRSFLLASRKETLIMHPLPRLNELNTDVDHMPHAAYFRMAHYGVTIRMALLLLCLNIDIE